MHHAWGGGGGGGGAAGGARLGNLIGKGSTVQEEGLGTRLLPNASNRECEAIVRYHECYLIVVMALYSSHKNNSVCLCSGTEGTDFVYSGPPKCGPLVYPATHPLGPEHL